MQLSSHKKFKINTHAKKLTFKSNWRTELRKEQSGISHTPTITTNMPHTYMHTHNNLPENNQIVFEILFSTTIHDYILYN